MSACDRYKSAGLFSLCRLEAAKILGSRRFQGLSVLFVLVLVWSSFLFLERYRVERGGQEHGQKQYWAEIAEARTIDNAASLWIPAWKPPWALAFVVDGGQASAPNYYRQQLTAWERPRLERKLERNLRLPSVLSLDWMFALFSVLFLAACLELYDSIGGERSSGLLRLTFSHALSRRRYLASKLLAGWFCMSCPLLLGMTLSLGVALHGEPEIATPQNLAKVAGVALLSLWAILFFVSLSLLASISAKDPANSLIALLTVWVGWVVVVPALAVLGAHQLVPLPMGVAVQQRSEEISARTGWRKRGIAARDDFKWEKISAPRQKRIFEDQEKLRRQVLLAKLRQARKAQDLASVFSPPALIQGLAERLTGTGFLRDEAFLHQVWEHRKSIEALLKGLDAEDPQSPHLLFFTGYMSERSLPEGALSEFRYRERTFQEGLDASWIGLAGLALETLLLIGVTFARFERYDLG